MGNHAICSTRTLGSGMHRLDIAVAGMEGEEMNPAIQAIFYTAATGKTSIVVSHDDGVRRYHASQAKELAVASGVPTRFRAPYSLLIDGGGEVVFLTVDKCDTSHKGKAFIDPFALIGLTPEKAQAVRQTGQGDPQPSRG